MSAALVLGRSRRRVIVCDAGEGRNRWASEMHAFLTRDGIPPGEFRRLAREEVARYPGVELRQATVVDARRLDHGFEIDLHDGTRLTGRTLLLATGVVDVLPRLRGIRDFYGTSVHHCPYCDGWEHRDRPVAVYGNGEYGKGLALSLTQWTRDLVLCTDGPAQFDAHDRERLARQEIALREEPIERLEGTDGRLARIVFTDGSVLEREALFFSTGQYQRSDLPERLGCRFTERGVVRTGKAEGTEVPGLFVAGDASVDAQLVIVAAGEGAQAAVAINTLLVKEDLVRTPPPPQPAPAAAARRRRAGA